VPAANDWRKALLRKGLLKTSTSGVNLSALGAGMLATAGLHSWAFLALGGITYVALCAWDLTTENFWKKLLAQDLKRANLPAAKNVQDAEVRAAVERIALAREAITRALAEAPPHVAEHVRVSMRGLDEMEANVAKLVELAEGLFSHLSRLDPSALEREHRSLGEKAQSTQDPESRALYEQAANARRDQLRAIQDLGQARERLLANLARIVNSLEGVPTRVVRMRVLDADSLGGSSADIGSEIGRINDEIGGLEQTLEVLAERSA
jgi:hypothetical protein